MTAKKITLPLSEKAARELSVGEMVLITGRLITGRDRFHKFLYHERPDKKDLPFSLEGSVLYHTGPIVKDGRVLAAGPTTSIRMEMYEPWAIEHYGLRGIMGKGGMGKRTQEALKEFGCVYFLTFGGAAVYLAERIKAAAGSFRLDEWGEVEASWVFDVEDFPAVVTMDAKGGNLHEEIEELSAENLRRVVSGQ